MYELEADKSLKTSSQTSSKGWQGHFMWEIDLNN
jgi:hypothetical protein